MPRQLVAQAMRAAPAWVVHPAVAGVASLDTNAFLVQGIPERCGDRRRNRSGLGRCGLLHDRESLCWKDWWRLRALQDQRRLLAHDPTRAADIGGVMLGELPGVAFTPDLASCFEHHRHASSKARLTEAEHPAMGVAREVTSKGQVVVADEGH